RTGRKLVRRCDPATLKASLSQLIERKRDLDFPWFPARVVCHDILGQTALVDLAGLRDAIAQQGGDPAQVNPVVPTQLIVDHSLAVECGGYDPEAFEKNRAIEDRRNEDRFHFIEWTKKAFKNVDVIPPGNGIMQRTGRKLVRRCDPATLKASLSQLIERKRDLDFP
ncbi:aconitase family protein, partial [Corynebacterium diphtheriae]